jgi:hypothetical protein
MPKYRVHLQTTASVTVEVEADGPDEALDAAYEHVPNDVCASCGGWGKNWSLDLGEWESDSQAPFDQVVEEVED